MDLLLPVATMVLVVLGGICMAISIRNDLRLRLRSVHSQDAAVAPRTRTSTIYEPSYSVTVRSSSKVEAKRA